MIKFYSIFFFKKKRLYFGKVKIIKKNYKKKNFNIINFNKRKKKKIES